MMGRSHVIFGGVAWLGLGIGAGATLDPTMTKAQLAVGALVTAGAALLPDLDHPESTIAHTLGPITKLLATGVSAAAGGHRHATHSLVFVGLMAALTFAALQLTWGAAAVVFLCAALALRVVGPARAGLTGALLAAGVTVAVVHYVPLGGWLAAAVALGTLCHVLADALTAEGVPLAWPLRFRVTIPLISHTGNVTEGLLVSAGLVGLIWLIWVGFGPVVVHSLHGVNAAHSLGAR